MPLVQYVENPDRGDNTSALRFEREGEPEVILELGGPAVELTDAEFSRAASMYSLAVVTAADAPQGDAPQDQPGENVAPDAPPVDVATTAPSESSESPSAPTPSGSRRGSSTTGA